MTSHIGDQNTAAGYQTMAFRLALHTYTYSHNYDWLFPHGRVLLQKPAKTSKNNSDKKMIVL